jgi:CRP-like cAMP-binding protein
MCEGGEPGLKLAISDPTMSTTVHSVGSSAMQKIQPSSGNGSAHVPAKASLLPRTKANGRARVDTRNRLLAGLSPGDLALVQPHLTQVDLGRGQILEAPETPLRHCYFIERGLVSVVAVGVRQGRLEVCIVGCEGMTGWAAVLHGDRSPNQTLVQVEGQGLRIAVNDLQNAMEKSRSLQRVLLEYVRGVMIQTADSALCIGTAKIEERLARWLLMADDRLDGDGIPLTHEALSALLGVRRASVTMALQNLQQKNLLLLCRGKIIISDRKGLEAGANGAYRMDPERRDINRSPSVMPSGGTVGGFSEQL